MTELLTEQVREPTDFKQLIHSSISFRESALRLIFWNAVITCWKMKQKTKSIITCNYMNNFTHIRFIQFLPRNQLTNQNKSMDKEDEQDNLTAQPFPIIKIKTNLQYYYLTIIIISSYTYCKTGMFNTRFCNTKILQIYFSKQCFLKIKNKIINEMNGVSPDNLLNKY